MTLDKITCPYCGREFYDLNPSHLKTHGKTIAMCRAEFPDIPNRQYSRPLISKSKPYNPSESDIYAYFQNKGTERLRASANGAKCSSQSKIRILASPK